MALRKVQGTFWSFYAQLYDFIWDSPVTRHVSAHIAKVVGTPENVVDLVCGTGLFSRPFTRSGAHTLGVDTSSTMLHRAVRTGRISEPQKANAAATGLPTGKYELVLCANVLHRHPEPEAVIAETRRLVKPGGHVVWVVPSPGMTRRQVLVTDLNTGRPWASSLTAHLARTAVTLLAALSRVQRTSSSAVLNGLHATAAKQRLPIETAPGMSQTQSVMISRAPDK
ncbi:class I SAM-dependent methyltransferase [Enteractinococcus fodinae]|nr:class I SAM-dependent methyltransferase [Enteractinococcus fodinae]